MSEEKPTFAEIRVGLRSILGHLRRHKRAYALGVVSLFLVDVIDSVAAPWLQGAAFANLDRAPGERWPFLWIGAAFLAGALVQMGLRYAWRHYFIKTADLI